MGGILSYFKKLEAKVLITGLDAAGKTTILYKLKLGEVVTTIPTIGFNVETLHYKNVELTSWDVGGRDKMRPLLRHYYGGTDVLIFVVDVNDTERLAQAKDELQGHLNDELLHKVKLVVLANKMDLVRSKDPTYDLKFLIESLGLEKCYHEKIVIPTVGLTGEGLEESLIWIVDKITNRNTTQNKMTTLFEESNDEGLFNKVWCFVKSLLIDSDLQK